MLVYGSRAKIGIMCPAPGHATEVESHIMAPEGVAVATARLHLEQSTPESCIRLADYVEEAARLLAATEPDVIIFSCTTNLSLVGIAPKSFNKFIDFQCEVAFKPFKSPVEAKIREPE